MIENNSIDNQPGSEVPVTPEPIDDQGLIAPHERLEDGLIDPITLAEDVAEPEIKPEKDEKKPPSRFKIFMRKALIALGVVALFFLAGFLTDHFTRYKPLADTLKETRTQLEEASQSVVDLAAQSENLLDLNKKAEDEIATLEAELNAARANALFYQVLVDVNNARIALFLDDLEGAQAALAETEVQLEELLPAIEAVDSDLALSLPNRLELVIAGIGRDQETGLIDLELFTKALLELEPLLALD